MSLVIRVTSVAGPMVSSSAYDSDWICAKSAWRRLAVAPVAALAEKYCAHVALAKPHRPSPTSTRHFFRIYAVSPDEMPTSMISAMMSGTRSSNAASSSLKHGARIACRR